MVVPLACFGDTWLYLWEWEWCMRVWLKWLRCGLTSYCSSSRMRANYIALGLLRLGANTTGYQCLLLPRIQKFLSYLVGMVWMHWRIAWLLIHYQGWLCATGWQAGLVSIAFLVGTIIQGLIVLNYPSYVFERWHGTLLVIAVTLFSIAFNTVFASRLPLVESTLLMIHIVGLLAVILPLWVLAPRANARDALLSFENSGGWPSTGLSAMIGLLTSMGALLGFDCAVHMGK